MLKAVENFLPNMNFDRTIKMLKNSILLVPPLFMVREVFGITVIQGRSMSPTLNPLSDKEGDVVLVLKTNGVKNGDIVFFSHPSDIGLSLVKRVKGMQNELCIFRGKSFAIPPGHFWAQSDEPFRSIDSSQFGPVPQGLVWGVGIAVIWPPKHFKLL